MEGWTKEELDGIAVGLRSGRVYADMHVPAGMSLSDVFLPLALMDQEALRELRDRRPGMLFEWMDKAGPRSVNGQPMFLSFRTLDQKEAEQVLETAGRLERAEKEALASGG